MSKLADSYTALSSTSPRAEVSQALQAIIDAPPFSFDTEVRKKLIQTLIDDVQTCNSSNGNKGRLVLNDASKAILATKMLGKMPVGSQVIAEPTNLKTLLGFSRSFKNDPEAGNEALRCVANALLLIERARGTWTDKEVGGGDACVDLLNKATAPDQIFLASRILFLCTVSSMTGATFIQSLVEDKRSGSSGTAVDILAQKLDILSASVASGTKMAREALTDTLKFTFNLLVHYPKMVDCEPQWPDSNGQGAKITDPDGKDVMGDYWSPKLSPVLAPLLRIFYTLSPTSPAPITSPLAETIHSLIIIPFSPALTPVWFGKGVSSNKAQSSSSAPSGNVQGQSSRSDSPVSGATKEKQGPMDRALSLFAAGRRSLSRSSSPSSTTASNSELLLRIQDLLEISLKHYLPGDIDPDDPSVREACKKEGEISLDDILSPLVVLITRLALVDDSARIRIREWIVPSDIDRTHPLEARSDLLGRVLRLLGSVHNARLKDAIGEMLFAACDSSATMLSAQVGYGNVAGFLFNKGVMTAPPQSDNSSLTTPSGVAINPITGTVQTEGPSHDDMTEEEREREAEKLFVLFDRLEKSGALPPSQNPIRKAAAEGKLG